jgi:hypothetical protein
MLEKKFEYEGIIYIRPVGRGIVLKEGRFDGFDLGEVLAQTFVGSLSEQGLFNVKIKIEVESQISEKEFEAAKNKPSP